MIFHYIVLKKPSIMVDADKTGCKVFCAMLEMQTGIIESANPI